MFGCGPPGERYLLVLLCGQLVWHIAEVAQDDGEWGVGGGDDLGMVSVEDLVRVSVRVRLRARVTI